MGDSIVGVAVGAAVGVGAALGCAAHARVLLLMEAATDSGLSVLKATRLTKVEEDVRDDECRDKRI